MPAMSPDNVLNSGQSYPCSFELLGAVKALEDAKQFVSVPLVKTGTVISNADDRFTWRKGLTQFDHRMFPSTGVFQCIRK